MSCRGIQKRLLRLESPDQPPPAIRVHLDVCAECRAWQERLLFLEEQVPLLSVPPCRPSAQFTDRLVAEGVGDDLLTVGEPALRLVGLTAEPARAVRRFVRDLRVWRTAAVAASVCLAVFGWWVFENFQILSTARAFETRVFRTDRLVADVLKSDLSLAVASGPDQRITGLAALANSLQRETLNLARCAHRGDLTELAQMHRRVVNDGLLASARNLSREERVRILPDVAEQLARAGNTAEGLVKNVSPVHAGACRQVAATSHAGEQELRRLLREPVR